MALLPFAARGHRISVSMTTVDTAWISAGSGLVGALVGASAALGGKWLDARHARQAEERRQAAELLARFWEVTDRMWRLGEEVDDLARWIDLYPVGDSPTPGDPPVTEEVQTDRRRRLEDAYRSGVAANSEAGVLLGRMRLLKLAIAEQADALRLTSMHYRGSIEALTKREQALAAYENAASRLMTS